MKIAVCITTRNRQHTFFQSFSHQWKLMPPSSRMFIVDDASDVRFVIHPWPENLSYYRFDHRVGIPRAKNKCLELAYDWGADHIFLFDDDAYPITDNWWLPYVEHEEPHLMYIFTGFGNQTKGIKEVYRDGDTVAYDHVRGCMLYLDRRVLDVVGGFDTAFGIGMYEHTDFTNRIFNAGLTTHRVMDVPDSRDLIHSMDEHQETQATFTQKERLTMMNKNRRLKLKKINSREYREFK